MRRLLRRVPIRWRLWGVYVALLSGVLGVLAVVADREAERLLVGAEMERTALRADRTIDRALGRAPLPPGPFQGPPRPFQGPPPGQPQGPPPGQSQGPPPGQPQGPPPGQPQGPPPGRPPGPLQGPPFEPVTPQNGLVRIARALVADLETPDAHVEVYTAQGDLVMAGANPFDLPPWPQATADEIRRVHAGAGARPEPRLDTTRAPRAVLMFFPIRDPNAQGVATIAVSLELPDLARTNLRWWLAVAAAGAAALGALVGVPVTRALLGPLGHIVATAERIGAGDPRARVGMAHADDEMGRLGATIDRMLDQLQETADAQRRFVADASHELRNPVTGLGGMIDIIRKLDPRDEAPFRRGLNAMERDVDRMRSLIEDLLVLSRLDAGSPVARYPVDVAALARDVVEAKRALGHERVRLGACGASIVPGDAEALQRVIQNLVDNAVVATAEGGEVCVAVEPTDGAVRVRVVDTGVGIAPEALPHLFERFYRADRARARRTGGSGLGLAIARGVAQAHGGDIEAFSEGAGRGATFTLTLPRP